MKSKILFLFFIFIFLASCDSQLPDEMEILPTDTSAIEPTIEELPTEMPLPDILEGIKTPFKAWESHNDEIKMMPDGFINLAHSASCKVQAFKYTKKPYYGLQFHPEVEHTEQGSDIFKNFVKICEEHKK